MKSAVIGSYPKIPSGEGVSIRRTLHQFERRSIGVREREEAFSAVAGAVLDRFAESRLDLATDGMIRYEDLTHPLTADFGNLRPGGLLRYFDNNFYYRHPVVSGRLFYRGGLLGRSLQESLGRAKVPLKAVLPGPFTLLSLSEDQSYGDASQLLSDMTECLALEAQDLAALGVAEIQWDEPSLVWPQAESGDDAFSALSELLSQKLACPQAVALYYGSAKPLLSRLERLGPDRVYFDLVTDPSLGEVLSQRALPFEVGAGLLDSRNVRLEEAADLRPVLEKVAAAQGKGRLWLHPNAGLELLPPDWAEMKVRRLGELAATFTEEGL